MNFWTSIMVKLWSQRFNVTLNYSYSNQKANNEQFHIICVALYGFDLNTVGHCSTQTMPIQGAIATPHPQSIFANIWKIYSSFIFLAGGSLEKSGRACASYCQHTEAGSTPEGLQKIRQKAVSKKK